MPAKLLELYMGYCVHMSSPDDLERRQSLISAILASEPVSVPDDPADLRRELDEAHLISGWRRPLP